MIRLGRRFQESFRAVTAIDDILRVDSSLALRHFHDAVEKFNNDQNRENGETAEFFAKASIRAFLGHVDGIGYALRRVVAQCADEANLPIPSKKLAELKERKYDAATDSVSEEEKRLSTEASLRVAVTWFPKLFGSDFRLDSNGEGWRGFKRLIRVRNDFTHPKRLEHLFPMAAFPAIQPTIVWFLVQMRNMFAECASKLGLALSPPEEVILEYPYKDSKYPISIVFSEQDIVAIQNVAARTMKYVELMIVKSSRDLNRALALIDSRSQPAQNHRYQYAIRNTVRTLFSEVEARTGAAMFFIEAAESRGEMRLSEADRQSLAEGEIEDKMVAALTIFSREFGNDYIPETTGELWKQFRGARFLRDRLTHPKESLSLKVDLRTTATLLKAAQYFASASYALRLDPYKCLSRAGLLESIIAEQATDQNENLEEQLAQGGE